MFSPSQICVVHYHLRPGGVRRIIELALPPLTRGTTVRRVTILTGEPGEKSWVQALQAELGAVKLRVVCDPACRYAADQRLDAETMRETIATTLERVITRPKETVLWVHNPGLARNLMLAEAVRRLITRTKIRTVFHHHDFWFENRWARWPEARQAGYRTLDAVADSIFATGAAVEHAAINRSDALVLKSRSTLHGTWMPNLAAPRQRPSAGETAHAARWLVDRLGEGAPCWLFPTRFLRRKNLAEAVLLTRWLRPDAWLVTTAGVSSSDEASYARRLEAAARDGKWRARFRLLEGAGREAPSIAALMAAAEMIVMTSAQEGFGLPSIEAVAAGRPLLARRLPNVVPDLEAMGFRLPWLYDEVWIDPVLLDGKRERIRQEQAWKRWKRTIPRGFRRFAECPPVLNAAEGSPLPFSRLTLTGQLEVLAHPPECAWKHCRNWNPDLKRWKAAIARGKFRMAEWPQGADAWLSGPAYARRFWEMVRREPEIVTSGDARAGQRDFVQQKLGRPSLYPILFPEQ